MKNWPKSNLSIVALKDHVSSPHVLRCALDAAGQDDVQRCIHKVRGLSKISTKRKSAKLKTALCTFYTSNMQIYVEISTKLGLIFLYIIKL
uniref:HTH_Tnp_Tc3_1 domain-containing protein n=1 Tax=Panagrellus redivivus TaxID=6233 RepID=A0A7E4US77_PANRE